MYCLKCRTVAQEGEKRCVACGARFRPLPYRGFVYLVMVTALAGVLVVATVGLWSAAREEGRAEEAKDASPRPTRTTEAATTVPEPVTVATTVVAADPKPVLATSIEASQTAGNSKNSCGDATTYSPQQVQDGDKTTAWRVKGDGTGQSLSLTLAGPTHLSEVGLLPGYAKIDACSGSDRFKQLRRITKVAWVFDDGTTVEQSFEERPDIQTTKVDVTSSHVTVEILGVTNGPTIDATTISELTLMGVPAAG
jgi:hypothetical protein